jgi:hypothetical protein
MIAAKVILDSLHPVRSAKQRGRLTTIECVLPRIILAELNTHRVFSRNSASSRAIPVAVTIGRVVEDPFVPLFSRNQRGMQEGPVFENEEAALMKEVWLSARDAAVYHAKKLSDMGVHKSVCNRLIEPFSWHTCIISSTYWDGFFKQRDSPLAEPHMELLAKAIKTALAESVPQRLNWGDFHAPFLLSEDYAFTGMDSLTKVSSARCARVSYLTHDGVRDQAKDLDLFGKLSTADPGHWSPLEHVAQPSSTPRPGNFGPWHQLRHMYDTPLTH